MSGSITESDASASEFDESWTPQQGTRGQLQENYNFQWEPPWKNLNIKIRLANGNISEHTSFLLVPIKMQFLMKHSLSKIHQIIHSTKCCQVDSINSSKEHLEIKVNSSAADEIFNEVENNLVNEVDEVLLKPIQRLPFTSKLAEEYLKKRLKRKKFAFEKHVLEATKRDMMSETTQQLSWEMNVTYTKFTITIDSDSKMTMKEQSELMGWKTVKVVREIKGDKLVTTMELENGIQMTAEMTKC
ncbi:unnamed protein product [Mytilus edulis]|uniref:Uncharacterized protein n=1 Tax=Mytilus edulis TaxID=6550 RepID=A0A8S3V373_MYTED|nr:unnamed protein product [Mytilus edulis]